MPDATMDGNVVLSCEIEHVENDRRGAGYYFRVKDSGGEEGDPIGPYETQEAAHDGFVRVAVELVRSAIIEELGLGEE